MLIRSSDDEEKSVLALNTEKEEIQQIYKIYTVYTYKLALVVCVKSCVYFILSSNVLRNGHYLGMQFTRFLEMK